MEFIVKGKVQGKARPRVTMRNGKAHAFTPDKTKEYEADILAAFLAAGGKKVKGPVCVHVETFRALPKSRPKKVVSEPDTFKPDGDNVLKCVLDALNGYAFDDDSQAVMLSVIKWPRTRCDEHIRVHVCPIKQRTVTEK